MLPFPDPSPKPSPQYFALLQTFGWHIRSIGSVVGIEAAFDEESSTFHDFLCIICLSFAAFTVRCRWSIWPPLRAAIARYRIWKGCYAQRVSRLNFFVAKIPTTNADVWLKVQKCLQQPKSKAVSRREPLRNLTAWSRKENCSGNRLKKSNSSNILSMYVKDTLSKAVPRTMT